MWVVSRFGLDKYLCNNVQKGRPAALLRLLRTMQFFFLKLVQGAHTGQRREDCRATTEPEAGCVEGPGNCPRDRKLLQLGTLGMTLFPGKQGPELPSNPTSVCKVASLSPAVSCPTARCDPGLQGPCPSSRSTRHALGINRSP
ncbi:hypothetical protein HJG60_009964 [Phyllostomus discolor]|uniref:Uncharacterized protein n=1 Tax=Phyllostomus discolor TaxID=89673 RepID=A0A834B314_9CHIR|nr:hypothetical protein HJG60_009964 [Phyllostomus discolor]